jgi:hypothetical protein
VFHGKLVLHSYKIKKTGRALTRVAKPHSTVDFLSKNGPKEDLNVSL